MKSFFVSALAALVLLGGGCLGSDGVEGKWRLTFDLPDDWVMVKNYRQDIDAAPTPSDDVTRNLSDIVLQSTSLAVYTGGIKPNDHVDPATYTTEDFTYIRVFRLDERRLIPSEAEDLSEGWWRVKVCDEGEDCTIYGVHNYHYYYDPGIGEKYKFTIVTKGQDVQDAIDVIMSAQVVTEYTDEPTVDGTVE